MAEWIDVSIPLRTGMLHWPGDPEPILERLMDMDRGDEVNVGFLKMTAHTGTHMDAGCHFLAQGSTIDQFPIEDGVGVAGAGDFRRCPAHRAGGPGGVWD